MSKLESHAGKVDVYRCAVAEALGTAFLLAAVVGSGIMGERLTGGNVAIALLANTMATGSALVALILTFGPISGGHFNLAVTLADASQGGVAWRHVPAYRYHSAAFHQFARRSDAAAEARPRS